MKNAEENLTAQRKLLTEKEDALEGLMTSSAEDSANAVDRDGTKLALLNIPIRSPPGSVPAPSVSAPQNDPHFPPHGADLVSPEFHEQRQWE